MQQMCITAIVSFVQEMKAAAKNKLVKCAWHLLSVWRQLRIYMPSKMKQTIFDCGYYSIIW